MFEISDKLNEQLQKLFFLEYLKVMHDKIESIQHRNTSDSAYKEARTYSSHVISRYVKEYNLTWEEYDKQSPGRHLRLSQDILDLYNTRESDKKKDARINEFVKEFTYDLSNMIRARERNKHDPDKPLEDDPI